jgi:hypothetical protein
MLRNFLILDKSPMDVFPTPRITNVDKLAVTIQALRTERTVFEGKL